MPIESLNENLEFILRVVDSSCDVAPCLHKKNEPHVSRSPRPSALALSLDQVGSAASSQNRFTGAACDNGHGLAAHGAK